MILARIEKILFFLTILFLPTQLGRHFWPQFSYIYSLKIDYLSPTIYFWDFLALGLFNVWMFQKPKINKLALNVFLLFIFTQLLSLLEAQNLGAGMVRLEQYLVSGMLGIYVASQKWMQFKKKILLPLIISVVVESLIAIGEVLKSASLGLWILGERSFSVTTAAIAKFDFQGLEILRPYATFSHPNVLGAFLLIGGMVVWIVGDGFKRKVVMVITFITIILTFSRATILASIFSSLFFLRKKAIILMVVLLIVLSPVLFTRFFSVFNFDSLTVLRREELAKSSIELFLIKPLFGVGINNFIPSLSSTIISGPNRFLQPVHNIFLLGLSETGVIGVIGLIGLIGYPVWLILKLFPKPLDNKVIASSAYSLNPIIIIWGVIIFLGMFDHYFLTLPQGYRLLFLVWGLSFSMLE